MSEEPLSLAASRSRVDGARRGGVGGDRQGQRRLGDVAGGVGGLGGQLCAPLVSTPVVTVQVAALAVTVSSSVSPS